MKTNKGILNRVMIMKNSKKELNTILKTVQMGQVGIRSVIDSKISDDLRKALESQLKEYDAIEHEAIKLSTQNGWWLNDLPNYTRTMSEITAKMKSIRKNPDTAVADMMITGNTKGVINSLKYRHPYIGEDPAVASLAQKLLDTERSNIRQMESFL